MKKLAMIIMFLVAVGCDKNNDDNPVQTVNAIGIEFSIVDENGNDLLNPASLNAYQEDDIKLYYEIGGVKKEVNSPSSTNPDGILIYQHESEYRIGIALNHDENEPLPITYIQWNATDTDTLKAEFRRWGASNIAVEKVWYNNELKNNFYFQIEK